MPTAHGHMVYFSKGGRLREKTKLAIKVASRFPVNLGLRQTESGYCSN